MITLVLQVNHSNSQIKKLLVPKTTCNAEIKLHSSSFIPSKVLWNNPLGSDRHFRLHYALLAIYPKVFGSLGHFGKGEQRMKVGYQSSYQMLHLGLHCINPPTSGREIMRCCSVPAALHFSCCRRCALVIPLNKYISLHFLDLRAWNVCSSSGIVFQSHMLCPRTIR